MMEVVIGGGGALMFVQPSSFFNCGVGMKRWKKMRGIV